MRALTVLVLFLSFAVPVAAQADGASRRTVGGPTPLAGGSPILQPETLPGTYLDPVSLRNWSGIDAKSQRATTVVVRTADEWLQLWRSKIGRSTPIDALPKNSMAIAIMIGQRPSKGYSIGILSVRINEGDAYVNYVENRPSYEQRRRPVNPEPTSPWTVFVMPLVDGGVRFTRAQSQD